MKYVWLVQIVVVFLFKIDTIWPLQEESNIFDDNEYDFPLSKMSKVCSFLAESCGKCTELRACFWCSDSISGPGNCYARSDMSARHRCIGKVISYWKKPCNDINKNLYSSVDSERSVLIKLLLLLRKLRDSSSQNNKQNKKLWHKNEISEIPGTSLPIHFRNMGDMSNKELKKKIGILTNTSYISSQNTVHNLSSIVNQINFTTFIKNNTDTNSFNSTKNDTIKFHKLAAINITNVNKHKDNKTLRCSVNGSDSCTRKHYCSWCENKTCCASDEISKTDKIIQTTPVQVRIKQNETTISCTDRQSCNTCVEDISCYWCGETATCRKFPGNSYVSEECKGVSHKTCSQQIPIYAIAIWIMLITFFVSVGYICVRKCYYFQLKPVEVKLEERPILFKQKNGRTVYQITESEEEDEELMSRSGKDSYTPSKVGAAPNNPAVW